MYGKHPKIGHTLYSSGEVLLSSQSRFTGAGLVGKAIKSDSIIARPPLIVACPEHPVVKSTLFLFLGGNRIGVEG